MLLRYKVRLAYTPATHKCTSRHAYRPNALQSTCRHVVHQCLADAYATTFSTMAPVGRLPAGANTRDMPARITDYVPTESDVGGFFDNRDRALRAYSDKAKQ